MSFKEKPKPTIEQENPTPSGGPDNNKLGELKNKGLSFKAAAAGAINKALSSNSEEFLKANRQSGGQ